MPVIRILLLLVVLGGLALLPLQNMSPVLSIVFLGMKTQALPVAVWVLMALAAGFFTSTLLGLLSYLQSRPLQARIRQLEAEPPRASAKASESSKTTSQQTSYAPPQQQTTTTDDASDWDVEDSSGEEEEWDFDEKPATTSSNQTVDRNPTDYEVKQEPKSSTRTGTVYSYGYREPKNSGVGRTEAVYDANYRVITPPYRDTSNQQQSEDDWGLFEDEDEFDDEDKGSP
jgi:hypothetical protein